MCINYSYKINTYTVFLSIFTIGEYINFNVNKKYIKE